MNAPVVNERDLVEELRAAIFELERVQKLREDAVTLLCSTATELQQARTRHAAAIAAFDRYVRAKVTGRNAA